MVSAVATDLSGMEALILKGYFRQHMNRLLKIMFLLVPPLPVPAIWGLHLMFYS